MKLFAALPTFLVLLCGTNLAIGQETDRLAFEGSDEVIVTWLRQNVFPLRHVEPGNGSADLEPLKQVLKEVKIVGLGEATHGTREFFQVKHRLLEFLVSEMGFNVFALESSYAACEPINEYVLNGEGDRATVLSNQGYIPWDTEEFSEMLDWMRAYNQSVPDEKKVRFYGLDPVYNGLGREKTLQYLRAHSPARVSSTDSLFRILDEEDAKWPMQIDDKARKILEDSLPHLDDLSNHLTANNEQYIRDSSSAEFDQVSLYIQLMKQFAWMSISKKNSLRSQYKAENMEYLVDHEEPDAKFVIWEHNEHVSGNGKESQIVEDSLINPYMGHFLREKYADRYYAFGLDFSQGSFQTRLLYPGEASGELKENAVPPAPVGSLPWYLARTNIGNLMLDVRGPTDNPVVDRWLETPQAVHEASWGYQDPSEVYTELSIKRHYDGIIFIEKTTATRPTPNALKAVSNREKF